MYGGCRYEAGATGCKTKFSVVYGSHLFICFYLAVRANTRSVDLLIINNYWVRFLCYPEQMKVEVRVYIILSPRLRLIS